MSFSADSIEQMNKIAAEIAGNLSGGDILLLSGTLGAGKTTLTKGIAAALGLSAEVTSPTFALMQQYDLPEPKHDIEQIVHIDTYRLNDESELKAIGAMDYIGDEKTLTIIEWPEKLATLLSGLKTKHLQLSHADDGRQIEWISASS